MGRLTFLSAVFTAVLVIVLPFVGGGGPGIGQVAYSGLTPTDGATGIIAASSAPTTASSTTEPSTTTASEGSTAATGSTSTSASSTESAAATSASTTVTDTEHLAQAPVPKPVPPSTSTGSTAGMAERRATYEAAGQSCPGMPGGGTAGAPSATSPLGVAGTTSDDLASFASKYNAIRVSQCLEPVPFANIRYDSCMEQRLFWMAESPSLDPADAWGHMGSVRIDGVPSVGCDGNLAGGSGNTGATVAQKWWDSSSHRASLYRPTYTGSTANVCILFAMTHGGVPNEAYSFTRAAARWTSC